MILYLKRILFSGDARTSLAKKNIIGSFGLKLVDVIIDLLIVPIALAYLTQTNYGIWLTISSMVVWLNLFDVGISHGLRNKLAAALSNNNESLIKVYTSTAYVIIGVISIVMAVVCFATVPFVNWTYILNVDTVDNATLVNVLLIVLLSFVLTLTLKIITSIFLARQMPVMVAAVNTMTKIGIFLFLIMLFYFTDQDNLVYFAMGYSLLPVLILLLTSITLFNAKYKIFKPSIASFEHKRIKEIMGIGISFFIIQIGATMLFMTDNIIIAQLYGPSAVTPYQITNKYFGVMLMLFVIIITPYWSAITDAYQKSELQWIKNSIKGLHKVWFIFIGFSSLLLLLCNPVVRMWVGTEIEIPFLLAVQFFIFVTLQTLNNIYTFFLNGTGVLRMQLITGVISIVVNIPLSIFFAKTLGLGNAGVILATNCSILMYIIIRKIQYHKIINGTANGIWSK